LFSTRISQSPGPDADTTTCDPGGAVTVLLARPSADFTVTVSPPPPPDVVALTVPPPAVTLDDMPPALELDETPLPVVELLCMVHPPDDDALLLLEVCAPAGVAASTAAEMMIAAFMASLPGVCPASRTCGRRRLFPAPVPSAGGFRARPREFRLSAAVLRRGGLFQR
jgi:hypothetical protein